MQFSFEHSLKTLPGLKGSRKSSSEWEIWRFSPSLQDAILEQDRTRYLFIAQKASRTWGWSHRKWRQLNRSKSTDAQMVSEKYGGLWRGWNVPCKWIWRPCFTLGSFSKMGDLFLCCNVWFRAWPSVRGKHQRVFRSLRSCFEKRAILGTERRIFKHVVMADLLRLELF